MNNTEALKTIAKSQVEVLVNIANIELSEKQLDNVNGGSAPSPCVIKGYARF
jgi:bacteriocin-like protein